MNFHYSFSFSNLPEHLYFVRITNVIVQTELEKNLLYVREGSGMIKGRKSKLYSVSYDAFNFHSTHVYLICCFL